MSSSTNSRAAVGFAVLLLLTAVACNPHKVTANPEAPVIVPDGFSVKSDRPLPEKWWKDFGDPELDGLIKATLEQNLQLKAAWSRLRQSQAVLAQAKSGWWPMLDFSASAGRSEIRSPFADANGGGAMVGPETFTVDSFKMSLAAAYEVDVWKKVSSRVGGSVLDAQAFRDDVESIAMSLVSEVAEAWFDVVAQKSEKKLLEEQLRINETFLELTRLRFQQGLASALDIYQQEQIIHQRRGQLALVDARIIVSQHRISVLVGKPPKLVVTEARDALPELPPLPGLGLPVNLLDRRPDVRAARRRVEAADYRVAAAVADRLPSLRLSGSLGLQNGDITELIAKPLYSLLASITAPLFDGKRRKAEVVRTKAVVEERLATYGHSLLVAMTEVENALVQEKQIAAQIEALRGEASVAENALREAQNRYREGLSDFLPVLNALQTLQLSQISIIRAQRQIISQRLQLLRALGGTWTHSLTPVEEGA